MHAKLAMIAVTTLLATASGIAFGMTTTSPQIECSVADGGKLSKNSGGADALCRAIEAAISEMSSEGKFRVKVVVSGPNRISVEVRTSDGRTLVKQKYGSTDRELSNSSFQRFAKGLASEIYNTSNE